MCKILLFLSALALTCVLFLFSWVRSQSFRTVTVGVALTCRSYQQIRLSYTKWACLDLTKRPPGPQSSPDRHPSPFFLTSRAKTPSTQVVVVPAPYHHAPFSAFRPLSANLPSLARYFFPPRGPAALGAALLRGGATRRHLQDCFRALLSRRVAGRPPGARQGRRLRGGGTGDARARRRRPPSLPPSRWAPRAALCPGRWLRRAPRSSSPVAASYFPPLCVMSGSWLFFSSFFTFKKIPSLALSTFHLPFRLPGWFFPLIFGLAHEPPRELPEKDQQRWLWIFAAGGQ